MMKENCQREYDFALVLDGNAVLGTDLENALFDAGCDDATFGIQYGRLYAEFSRTSSSLKDAILSAISDVRKANAGVSVARVDECNLVTQSEIARRINRPRQMIHQYISGIRGPGNFPAPACHLMEGAPLWAWCAVSYWLAQNNIIRPEEGWNAQVVATINNLLELAQQHKRNPDLLKEIENAMQAIAV